MYKSLVYLLDKISIPEWIINLIWPVFPFVGILFISMFFGVVFLVLMERRVLALVTVRKGPNSVGYDGIFQSFADGIKIMFKEDIIPQGANKVLFTIAPCLVIAPTLITYAVLPFTGNLVASNIAVGLLFVLGISSIPTIALVIAGWSSNNKYSLLGSLRSAAQAISYEIPLVLATIAVVILAGSLNLSDIIHSQKSIPSNGEWLFSSLTGFVASFDSLKDIMVPFLNWNFWYFGCFANFLGCLVFFICAIAEVNRIPFDLPEAESELVSGYSTEYSGIKFALFFMAEYAALLVVASMTVILFFGGYLPYFNDYIVNIFLNLFPSIANLPIITPDIINVLIHLEQAAWFVFKIWLFIFVVMWVRATLPRLRVDQMMAFCWKFLLPVALLNLLVVTIIHEISYRTLG